jgi:hypothetical protein
VYRVVRCVPLKDLRYTFVISQPLSARSGGQIGCNKGIQYGIVCKRKSIQILGQPPFGGFETGAGVVRN